MAAESSPPKKKTYRRLELENQALRLLNEQLCADNDRLRERINRRAEVNASILERFGGRWPTRAEISEMQSAQWRSERGRRAGIASGAARRAK